jgi:hypothetical protein
VFISVRSTKSGTIDNVIHVLKYRQYRLTINSHKGYASRGSSGGDGRVGSDGSMCRVDSSGSAHNTFLGMECQ